MKMEKIRQLEQRRGEERREEIRRVQERLVIEGSNGSFFGRYLVGIIICLHGRHDELLILGSVSGPVLLRR